MDFVVMSRDPVFITRDSLQNAADSAIDAAAFILVPRDLAIAATAFYLDFDI